MEITTLMHQDGIFLFDNPKSSKIAGGTSYEQLNLLTYDLYKTWKDTIINARISTNLDEIYNTLGKENFEELNRIINEFSTLPLNQLLYNPTTELIAKRDELIEEAKEVYRRMLEYQERLKSL